MSKNNISFAPGEQIVFTDMVKVTLPWEMTVVNIPAGTTGVIEEVVEEDHYRIRCRPATAWQAFSFVADTSDIEFLHKIAPAAQVEPGSLPPLAGQAIYDEDQPGFLRGVSEYLIVDPEGDYLLYKREPFTAWTIEVRFYEEANPPQDVTGVFRGALADGKEIEQFTLLPKEGEPDYALVQVQIFSTRRARVYTYLPAEVEVDSYKKIVTIRLLCWFEFDRSQLKIIPLG